MKEYLKLSVLRDPEKTQFGKLNTAVIPGVDLKLFCDFKGLYENSRFKFYQLQDSTRILKSPHLSFFLKSLEKIVNIIFSAKFLRKTPVIILSNV